MRRTACIGGIVLRSRVVSWAAFLSLPALACSSGSDADTDVSGDHTVAIAPTVRDSAGVSIVENAEPQWAQGAEWCVGDVLTSVGQAEGELAYQLFRVLAATRQSDGTVAIGNSSSGEIRFFDRDGVFVRTVGSTDGGPGEFRGASALRALRRVPGDTLVTWDIYAQSISVFAPDGTFVRSYRLAGPAKQHFFRGIYEDRSLLMLAYEYTRTGSGDGMVEGLNRDGMLLLHYGTDHVLAGSLEGLPASDRFQAPWGPSGMMSMDAPFGRVSTVNAGGAHTYVATGDSDEVAVYDRSGVLQMLIRRTTGPVEVTSEMIARDRTRRTEVDQELMEDENTSARTRRMYADLPYPEVLPPYGRTVLDSEQNLWAEDFRVGEGDPHSWSVFDEAGTWLGRVSLPGAFRVYEVGSDYLLVRAVDDLGVERVKVLELVKGQGCGATPRDR